MDYFEEFLNIIPKKDDDYEARRTHIKILLNAHDVSTIKFMTDLANKFLTDNSAKIIEHNSEYWFEVFFNIDGLISLGDLRAAIELYKPAHLGFKIVFYILSKILISHKVSIIQYINAKHNFWNLGTAENTYWDGVWCFNGSIDWSSIKPDAKYKERQTHFVNITSLINPFLWINLEQKLQDKLYINSKIKRVINFSSNFIANINPKQLITIKYKTLNTNKLTTKQNRTANTKNCWDGSFCLDGSHILSGAYEINKQMENICVFYSTKHGIVNEGSREIL